MATYYLLKTEPSEYSSADLQKDGVTEWDGVSNPAALKNLREMEPQTALVIYKTEDRKSAVGPAPGMSQESSNPMKPLVNDKSEKPINPLSNAQTKPTKP